MAGKEEYSSRHAEGSDGVLSVGEKGHGARLRKLAVGEDLTARHLSVQRPTADRGARASAWGWERYTEGFVGRFIPVMVAAANGIVVAAITYYNQHGNYPNQHGNYPPRFLAAQIAVVFAALVLSSRNLRVRAIGLFLIFASVVLTFSAMFLYIPTIAAALWMLASRQGLPDLES